MSNESVDITRYDGQLILYRIEKLEALLEVHTTKDELSMQEISKHINDIKIMFAKRNGYVDSKLAFIAGVSATISFLVSLISTYLIKSFS